MHEHKQKSASTVNHILKFVLRELRDVFGVNFREFNTVMRHDCGKEFVNKTISATLAKFGIIDSNTNPYSPEENGLVERPNCTVKMGIDLKMRDENESTWTGTLPTVISNYNNTIHSVTQRTPKEVLNQIAPIRLKDKSSREQAEIRINVKLLVHDIRLIKQKERVNKRRAKANGSVGLQDFQIGQMIMVSKPPYAKSITISVGSPSKRKAKIVRATEGFKFFVQWQRTGGFLPQEKPFTESVYPIDPKFFSNRFLGCDKELASNTEEMFEEVCDNESGGDGESMNQFVEESSQTFQICS
ncbi:hypothetical protein C9374_012921 [Naegleria lovaniensis]|uniref:Integrase catalytic domain-containing protein n=1 Tax=Naegleria lovaniensis TaxID=51637 RepID=A0AA88GCQ1_NAELO|nr:uncharacterized protein C9374_012921 [Naegleria lovaniensis]KAG2373075.1 hypothetical protein C9374_012921 [Naegleria lovaniensis]